MPATARASLSVVRSLPYKARLALARAALQQAEVRLGRWARQPTDRNRPCPTCKRALKRCCLSCSCQDNPCMCGHERDYEAWVDSLAGTDLPLPVIHGVDELDKQLRAIALDGEDGDVIVTDGGTLTFVDKQEVPAVHRIALFALNWWPGQEAAQALVIKRLELMDFI